MKYNFTLLKIVRTLLFALCCMIGAAQAIAQSYTPSNVQTGGLYAGLTSDNSGNLYVMRHTSGSIYQLEKWPAANPAGAVILATGVRSAAYDYPSSIAVNSTTGDVFYLNPDAGTNNFGQIMRIPGGVAGTATQVQVGRYFSAIALDNTGNLVTIEYNGTNYAVVRYNTTGTGSGTPLYSGLTITSSPDGTSPWGLAVDRLTNDVYLTDTYPNSDQAGEPGLIKLTAPAFTRTNLQFGRHFTSLYVDGSSTLFAIEQASSGSANYKVVKYTNPAGTGSEIYPAAISGGTMLTSAFGVYPWGITGNSGGDIYVDDGFSTTPTDGRLLKLAAPTITVQSINRVAAATNPTNSSTVQFLVTFSDVATTVPASAFTLTTTGSISGASINPSITGSGTTRTVTVNTGSGDGTIRLDVVTNPGIVPTVTNAPRNGDQTFTIDKTGPLVSSVTVPTSNTYIIGNQLNFTVNFSENVTVTGTPSIPVTIGSNTVQATYVSGTGSNALVFRYTVQGGDSDNDGIAVGSAIALNGGTLKDAVGNDATLTLNSIGSTAAVFVNTKQPVPTITTAATLPVTGAFTITITFDEPVTGTLVAGEFTSLNATLSGVTPVNSTTWTATITPPAGQQNGSGSVRVDANAVTNVPGNPSLMSNTLNISWDTKAPVITVTPPANKYYKEAEVISFTVSYDEDVVVTGAPTLPVTINGNTRQATYAAGGDARTLIFSYTVAAGEQDLDGIDLAANIALNGGTIKDIAGNNAPTGIATTNYPNILVDGLAPTVTSVAMPGAGPTPSGYYNAGTTLVFKVNTSETVTVSGTPTFDVIIGSTTRQATYVSNTGNQLTFIYNIVDGDNDADGITIGSQINFPGGSSIRDAATNNLIATLNGIGDGSGIRINTNHPTVTITATSPLPATVVAPFMITVTFSEQTTDALALADFNLTGCTISALSTTDNISWEGLITPTANAQGAATIDLPADVVHNIATNGNQAAATYNFNYDTKSPAITSITPPTDGTYKAGQTLTFTINYDDNFTVTGAPVLPIIIGSNTRNATLTGSTATSLTFSYTIVNGDQDADGIALGNIALNGGTIKDPVGHDAALTTSGSYAGILVDATLPTVTSVDVPGNGYYKATQQLNFTVHTSESVAVTGAPTLDVLIGGVTRKAAFTGGSGTNALTFAYTVVAGDNDMDGIAVGTLNPEVGTLQDAAGNDMVLTLNNVGPTNNVFVNTVIPSVTISCPQEGGLFSAPITVTAVFSEDVTGLALGDISCTNCTANTLMQVDGKTYTFQVSGSSFGAVQIQIPAGAAQNIGNNDNTASNTINSTYDNVVPFVNNITLPPGNYKLGDIVTFTVNQSERVVVSSEPYLAFNVGSNPERANIDVALSDAEPASVFKYQVKAGDFDNDGVVLTSSTIVLNGGTMRDIAGNNMNVNIPAGSLSFTGVVIDGIIPAVTSVDVPINGYYKAGDVLDFRIHTSENITVTGAPTLDVNIGGVIRTAAFTGGSGSQVLTFAYTVVTGDNDDDGIALDALSLNGGTLQDAVGNNMNLTLNMVPSTAGVFVNTVTPTVTLSGTPVLNGPWTMTITFSEPVTGLATTDFNPGTTNADLSNLVAVGSSGSVYTVDVLPPADGPVSISLPANAVVNVGDNGNSASNPITYTFDGTAPTVTSVAVPANGTYTNSDVLNFDVNFSEAVTVSGGTPSLPVTIGTTTVQANYTSGTGTTTLTFSYSVQNGDYDMNGIAIGAAMVLNGASIKDAANNNAVLTLNSIGNTTAVLVDAVPPAITSVNVPGSAYYKAGDVLTFTVDFNENVDVTGTPSVPVIIGSTTVQANYTGGTGTTALTFSYTVVAGDNDMDGIAVGSVLALNGGTVKDGLGNDAALTLNSVGNTDDVRVNTVIPTVTLSGTPVLNGPWMMTITFSEAVTNFVATDITTTNANVSAPITSDNKVYTVMVSSPGNGPVSLNVPANSAFNIGGNGNSASNPINYTYDGTAPAVTAVNVPSAGGYNAGDVLSFTANFDENVVVTGTPSIPVTIGAIAVQATYVSGSGTNALVFTYTVQNGDNDADGIAVGAAIALNGGTIKDAATNNAVLTLNSVGTTSGVIVDAVAPVVTSVTVPGNGYYKGGQQLNFTVHFSENVTPSAVPSIPVIIGSTTVEADYVSGSGTTGLLFTYTVQPGDMDMDGIAVGSAIALNLGTIKDGVGNDAVLALNNIGNTSGVFVNTNSPTVVLSGTPVLNGPWTMTVTFSEVVTGFALADITATNATLSILNQTNSTTYTVLVTAAANGTVTLNVPANIADNIAGNGNAASNTISYSHDGTAPAITSVNVPANGTYNSGDVLTFTANFDENVTVTGTPSLPLIIGSTNVQATYTGGSGTSALAFSYTVQNNESDLDGIALGAALQLNGGTIKDAATNNAVLTINGAGNTSAVLVDALAPVISSVTVPANGYYKAGDALNFTVQFSEPIVSAGSAATLPVTIGATTVQATIFSTPTPNTIVFRYVVQTGEEDLDGISVGTALVPGGTAIRDAAGNNASLTLNNVGNTSNVFILANRPTVTITGAISLTQPWTATITFSHAVTGFALTDITLTNAVASNLQTNDNITYTALISPVIQGGVSIEVLPNIAQDAAGNQNLPSSRLSYYYDPNPPVITSVEVPANGYYKQGDVLNFAVNWNEVVRNNVSPSKLTLPVTIGSTTVQAAYTGGYTTQRITFAYTVQAGQMDLDGIQLGTALQLPAGAEHVTDLTGNNANLTLNSVPATTGVFVHTARPSVTLSSAAATRVNAPFSVTITFNELVTGLALTDFTLTNATVSNLQTTDNITYTVLVTPTADGAASISLPADAAVNVVSNGNTASNTITRTYDATPPAIAAGQLFTVSQYSAAGTIVGTVTATDASGTVENWALATDGSGGALQISTAGVISVKNTTLLNALVGTDVSLGLTVSDGLNTSAAVPVTVRVVFVNQPPTLDVISNVAICKDVQTHTIQLTGASATEPAQTYTITATSTSNIFDVLTVGAGNVLSYRLKADAPAGTATVAVTIRDNGGTTGGAIDSLRRTFTITVNALPVITITSDKGASISKGDIVKLTAAGGSTYVWTAADGIISGQRSPVLEVKPMANASYEVTAASAAGCTAVGSFALSVVVDFKVDAVNILTPNGDGRNDRWVIRNLDSYPDNEVKIYDRAGRLIYSRRNYSNDWDGTVNGSPLAEGTYYYILTIQNGAKTATGYITIVRDRY